jgi:hypothetical protein
MLAPKIENKTQNARTCEIELKKCEKRKHRNPCQKPSTLAHFRFSLEKKRFLAKKKTHNEKNFVILVERRAFSRERGKKKNSLEKCCKTFHASSKLPHAFAQLKKCMPHALHA